MSIEYRRDKLRFIKNGSETREIVATRVTKKSGDMYVKKVHGKNPYLDGLTDMDLVECTANDGEIYMFYNGLGHDDSVKDLVDTITSGNVAERLSLTVGSAKKPGFFTRYVSRLLQ